MPFVLDACAMIAFLRGEHGAEVVEGILLEEPVQCLAHSVNMCEVFYDFLRSEDEAVALEAVRDLALVGIAVRQDIDSEFWQDVGRLKVGHKMPLADGFAVALARRAGAQVVTSDHGHFEALAQTRTCQVRFIR